VRETSYLFHPTHFCLATTLQLHAFARHFASWPTGPLAIRHFDFSFFVFNPGIKRIKNRDSWYMAWDGHWARTRDWQAYHHYHRKHPGDNVPFPTPFYGSAKRKCGLLPQRHGHRVKCRCNHNFICLAKFSCLRLCAGWLNNNNNEEKVYSSLIFVLFCIA